jgi:hypothetical protein
MTYTYLPVIKDNTICMLKGVVLVMEVPTTIGSRMLTRQETGFPFQTATQTASNFLCKCFRLRVELQKKNAFHTGIILILSVPYELE